MHGRQLRGSVSVETDVAMPVEARHASGWMDG